MSNVEQLLPPAFAELEPFVAAWGDLATTNERYAKRIASPMVELRAFYDSAAPRAQDIFDHLNGTAYGTVLPAEDQRLRALAMALTEIAVAVEVFGQPGVPHASAKHQMKLSWSDEK